MAEGNIRHIAVAEIPITFDAGAADQGLAGGGSKMCSFRVFGNVACLTLSVIFTKEATTASWYRIATIPSQYAPQVNLYQPWFRFDNTFYGELHVDQGGGININNKEAFTDVILRCNISWIFIR